jgi:prepilin-type N-terminal cleavage/methylation domain-containing protein
MGTRGVTIPEILVSIVILAVGLLGLGASGLYITGLVARGERVGAAVTFASRRLELLRAGACVPAPRGTGSEHLMRGSALLAANSWLIADGGGGTVRIRVISTYQLAGRRSRSDTIETVVVCG